MWINCNPNPKERMTGDCAVRAISLALNRNWDYVFLTLVAKAFDLKFMPDDKAVFNAVLSDLGYKRFVIPDTCPECYTADDFCNDHPKGIYILVLGNHVACVKDGNLLDAWDSSHEIPQYYWAKEE